MTTTEMTQEVRHQAALDKYLEATPQLKEEIKDLSADDQRDQVQWAFEDEAESQNLQPWELTLKYTSTPKSSKPHGSPCTRKRPKCWVSNGKSTAR